jgi:hypothetical protein
MFSRQVCLFCQRTGRKMTREHAMPNWVLSVLPPGKEWTIFNVSPRLPGFLRSWFSSGQTGVQVKGVCKDCNEGWMSKLEVATKRILTPLIRGEREHEFVREERDMLVTWAIKTWMMFDATTRRSEGAMVFAADERTFVMQTMKVPKSVNAIVFLAPLQRTSRDLRRLWSSRNQRSAAARTSLAGGHKPIKSVLLGNNRHRSTCNSDDG